MAGVKGRSGRKRDPRNAVSYFNRLYDKHALKLAEVSIDKALGGDREMLIYCHDRRLGKPKQQTDIELTGAGDIGAEMLVRLLEQIQLRRTLQLTGGDNGQEGTSEVTEAETA